MTAKCFGSGSSGNCWIFTSNTGCRLVVDMGFPWNEIKRFLNFDLNNVHFIITHIDHGDHGKGAKGAIKDGCSIKYRFEEMETFGMGEFTVMAFPVVHNVPTHGFIFSHSECGTCVFMTDTSFVPYKFEGVNHWLIEANYCESILEDRAFKSEATFLYERVLKDHLSIQQCEKVLMNQDLSKTEDIVLLHLSDSNSNEAQFVDRIRKLTGKPTYAAKPGLTLDFTLWA